MARDCHLYSNGKRINPGKSMSASLATLSADEQTDLEELFTQAGEDPVEIHRAEQVVHQVLYVNLQDATEELSS